MNRRQKFGSTAVISAAVFVATMIGGSPADAVTPCPNNSVCLYAKTGQLMFEENASVMHNTGRYYRVAHPQNTYYIPYWMTNSSLGRFCTYGVGISGYEVANSVNARTVGPLRQPLADAVKAC